MTRVGTDGAQALRYILSIGPEEHRPKDWRPANPSQLLAVLLLAGARLGIGSTWDLRTLDRRSSSFFIPADYRDFGRKVIENGMNYTHNVGLECGQQPTLPRSLTLPSSRALRVTPLGFLRKGWSCAQRHPCYSPTDSRFCLSAHCSVQASVEQVSVLTIDTLGAPVSTSRPPAAGPCVTSTAPSKPPTPTAARSCRAVSFGVWS